MLTLKEVRNRNLVNLGVHIDNALVELCPFDGDSILIPFGHLPYLNETIEKESFLKALEELGYYEEYSIEIIREYDDYEEEDGCGGELVSTITNSFLKFTPIKKNEA